MGMVAIDKRGRTILTEEQAQMVAVFLASIRGTLRTEKVVSVADWKDVREVLSALVAAGWAVVPQSQLDGWKKMLAEEDVLVSGEYMTKGDPEGTTGNS
jgi:hypothetical protein